MSGDRRYAGVLQGLVAALGLLGLWLVATPFVLPGAEFPLLYVVVGALSALIAGWYLVRVRRTSEAKVPSLWYLFVLAVLLLTGTVSVQTPGTAFFWSTVVTTALIAALVLVSIAWGSRFLAGEGHETTIFG